MQCHVCKKKKNKTKQENSSFDFEYWYMEQQGQPLHPRQLKATTNRTSNTYSPLDPAFMRVCLYARAKPCTRSGV